VDCVIYIDVFLFVNFWMNLLIVFLVRKLTKTYRTFCCILAAGIGAGMSTVSLLLFLKTENEMLSVLLHMAEVLTINLIAYGKFNILWHLGLFILTGAVVAGLETAVCSAMATGAQFPVVLAVTLACALVCSALEKSCRMRLTEESMKIKTVLRYKDKKMVATALLDTGNKLYDPIFGRPVILVDERLLGEVVEDCRRFHPEKMQYIPYRSVGQRNGILEGVTLDSVSIKWKEKSYTFPNVIAVQTKENLYHGREYRIIFHYGLLKEREEMIC